MSLYFLFETIFPQKDITSIFKNPIYKTYLSSVTFTANFVISGKNIFLDELSLTSTFNNNGFNGNQEQFFH